MPNNVVPITPGGFYHIYNRGNNRENLFIEERNYSYFLNLWWKHTSFIAETWAYCLLKNHFHALVYIKGLTGSTKTPSKYFSNFFNAYARGVNIASRRTGALFERPFKRIPVDSETYLMRLIVYIHQNPQKHRFVEDFRHWGYSSYHDLTKDVPTYLERERVISFFGSRADFIRIHQEIQPQGDFEEED